MKFDIKDWETIKTFGRLGITMAVSVSVGNVCTKYVSHKYETKIEEPEYFLLIEQAEESEDGWINIPGTNVRVAPVFIEDELPDVDLLNKEDRQALLKCVKAKNDAWKKEQRRPRASVDASQRHFKECYSELRLEE